jgi:hypothetical protein
MTASNTQIVNAYENLGMAPNEIASSLEFDENAVKMVLASESALYRRNVSEKKETFSPEDAEEAALTMRSLMYSSEQDAVRYRCAKYILDERAGRHDVQGLAGTNININLINERLQQARAAIERAKSGKIIDV